jgi:hypothetical protein
MLSKYMLATITGLQAISGKSTTRIRCCNTDSSQLGSIIATAAVGWGMNSKDWPLGYEIPGIIVMLAGVVVFLFLQSKPPPETAEVVEPPVPELGESTNSQRYVLDFDFVHDTSSCIEDILWLSCDL